jgi:hypothetical protein
VVVLVLKEIRKTRGAEKPDWNIHGADECEANTFTGDIGNGKGTTTACSRMIARSAQKTRAAIDQRECWGLAGGLSRSPRNCRGFQNGAR